MRSKEQISAQIQKLRDEQIIVEDHKKIERAKMTVSIQMEGDLEEFKEYSNEWDKLQDKWRTLDTQINSLTWSIFP